MPDYPRVDIWMFVIPIVALAFLAAGVMALLKDGRI